MGNVLRAMKKSAQQSAQQSATADHRAVRVVSMAVANAEQAAAEPLETPETKVAQPAAPEAPAPAAPRLSPRTTDGPVAPRRRSSLLSPMILAHHRPRCRVVEQIRQVRTALIGLAGDGRVRCMITSAQPREGKTVTAVNLAYTFSEITDRRTLLIDADLRRGTIASLLGMTRRHGLGELLDGQCTLDQALWSAGRSNFHVLTAGTAPPERIGELLSGGRAEAVITELADMYDHVVIDSPPVISVADAGILGRFVDHAVLAVRLHHTRRRAVEQATGILEGVGVPVAGLIALDEKVTGRSDYRYDDYTY
ncbi:MAG: CpsD/CapB family tyrosine-protein kinase [Planctomycetota bacterium]